MFLVPSEQQPAPEAAGADEHQHNDEQQQQPTQKKRSKSRGSNPWSSSTGWKSVDIGDELILGADEFGFAGLEVLDASLIDPGWCRVARVCVWWLRRAGVLGLLCVCPPSLQLICQLLRPHCTSPPLHLSLCVRPCALLTLP